MLQNRGLDRYSCEKLKNYEKSIQQNQKIPPPLRREQKISVNKTKCTEKGAKMRKLWASKVLLQNQKAHWTGAEFFSKKS